VNDVVIAINGK